MSQRLAAMGVEKYSGLTRRPNSTPRWTGKINFDENALDKPLRWQKPRRIFVNSMSDLFHPEVDKAIVRRIWSVMESAPQHTFQILTKRPGRMSSLLATPEFPILENVWIGTSVESVKTINRIEYLRKTPAAIRFISFEPLIGSVGSPDLAGIDWVIVGGESGPGSRPMQPEWVAEIFHLTRSAAIPFFFKQWGGNLRTKAGRTYLGTEWNQTPEPKTTKPAKT